MPGTQSQLGVDRQRKKKFPEWGLSSGPQAQSQGHTCIHTHGHTLTHKKEDAIG